MGQTPVVTDPTWPLDVIDIDGIERNSEVHLERFKTVLLPFCAGTDITIETLSEYGMVSVGINENLWQNNIDVIVMGVTGAGKLLPKH